MYTGVMEAIGQKLVRLREERQMKPAALARLAGISRQTLWSIEHTGSSIPDSPTLARLAVAFQMTVSDLVADTTAQYQGEMVGGPMRASPSERGPAPRFFTLVQQRGNVEPSAWITKHIPVVRQNLHAGWMEPVETELPIPVTVPHDGNFLAMRVVGECMEPECSPGDLAIVDCDASPQVGEAVVVSIDGEQSLRYLVERNAERVVFAAEKPELADIVSSPDKAEIVGVIVAYQRLPKRLRRPVRRAV